MIRIAMCDDEMAELIKVSQYVNEYSAHNEHGISCTVFSNAMDFVDSHQKRPFDIVFLDIMMPALNGIQIAQEVRVSDRTVKIVFITSSADFAIDSYEVGAFYYMLKPVDKQKLFTLLDKVIASLNNQKSLMLKTSDGIIRLELNQLCYCEASRKEVLYTLVDGNVIKSSGQFFEASDALTKYPNFIQPHRSYIINLDYVKQIGVKDILLVNDVQIPISRTKYSQIKGIYMEYYLNEGDCV